MRIGDQLDLEVGPVAHGGHCVARHEGVVVFVRHAIPGERVRAVVTGLGGRGRFARADAVRIARGSPDRVDVRCPHAGPGGCGGCDWQHVRTPAQRALKTDVLREQLTRLGRVPAADLAGLSVDAVPGDADGLAWRTRMRWAVDDGGEPGLRRHRSHEVVRVGSCPLATAAVDDVGASRRAWPGCTEVTVVASSYGDRLVVAHPRQGHPEAPPAGLPDDVAVAGVRGRGWVRERAAGRDWRVSGAGFWQVHPGAADALVDTVRTLLRPRPGDHLLDLYSGVGLFAGALAGDLGPGGRVDAVEASADACADARRSLHDLPTVRLHQAAVERFLAHAAPRRCDLIVLDPPRAGAGPAVVRRLARLRARAVAYVACDPAALARDVAAFAAQGWRLSGVRGLDLFPMTHHLETVAFLTPGTGAEPGFPP